MHADQGKIIICWHNKAKRRGITGPLEQTLGTIRRTKRAIKTNQHAWNSTKNKKYHGYQLDNGCLRCLHYYPKREPTVRTIESNLQA